MKSHRAYERDDALARRIRANPYDRVTHLHFKGIEYQVVRSKLDMKIYVFKKPLLGEWNGQFIKNPPKSLVERARAQFARLDAQDVMQS